MSASPVAEVKRQRANCPPTGAEPGRDTFASSPTDASAMPRWANLKMVFWNRALEDGSGAGYVPNGPSWWH